jgi:putative chitinase
MIAVTSPGAEAIIKHWESKPLLKDKRWLAYILATAYHETAHTFDPVREIGRGRLRPYGRKRKLTGEPYTIDQIYYGRGHVQLTWYENYEKFGRLLKIDLLNNPDLALEMSTSIRIMYLGMTRGLFTGVNLGRYFNDEREDWVNARKIINGLDCADKIAEYGKEFLTLI